MTTSTTDNIYTLIPKIMLELGPIGKNKRNAAQGYSFRSIDDICDHLQDLLAKHGVFYIPYVESYEREERATKSGGALISTLALVRFTFYAADGSNVVGRTLGEGADSGDKSGNKAMTAAQKYALLNAFSIATNELKDSEYDSPEPVAKRSSATSSPKQPSPNTQLPATGQEVFAFFKATTSNGWSRTEAIKLLVDTYEDAGLTTDNWTTTVTAEMLNGIKACIEQSPKEVVNSSNG